MSATEAWTLTELTSGRPPGWQERLAAWDRRLARFPYATTAAVSTIAFGAYAGSLSNGFVYDDEAQVLLNPFVVNPHLWHRIFLGSVWSFQGAGVQTNFYRPLQLFCYWILYRLAGPNPAAFHAFNLLLYALTAAIVYRLGVRLLGGEAAALAAALLWALHPLHVEAVAWISALPDLGCGLFVLAALLLFLCAEQENRNSLGPHLLAAAVYFPALFFKETALALPLVLVAYWFFSPPPPEGSPWGRRALIGSLYLAPLAVYLALRQYALGHLTHAAGFWRVTSRDLAAALGLLGQHLRLFLWPAHLTVFRTFEPGPALRSPWPWLGLAALALTAAFRRRWPLPGFLLWWWLLTLLPCLDIRQLSFPLLADRFSYLPTVGLCLAFSRLALVEFPVARWSLPSASRAGADLTLAALAVVLLVWGGETVRAVPHWRDEETLLNYSLHQSPEAPTLHWTRGMVLEYRWGDYAGAEAEYELALRLNRAGFRRVPGVDYECTLGLGRVAQHRRDFEGARRDYESAARLLPQLSSAYDALGALYFPAGDYARAAPYFERAVAANPQDLGARFYLGTCYWKLGRYPEAALQFRATTGIDPGFRAGYEAEARARSAAGDLQGAAKARQVEGAR